MGMTALVSNSPEYKRMHKILHKELGLASEHSCEYCGKPAKDWAWIHGWDPMDINSYWPLCRSCHRLEDFTDEWRNNIREGAMGNQHAKGAHSWV